MVALVISGVADIAVSGFYFKKEKTGVVAYTNPLGFER
jgi:hypothetical protein